MKIKRTIAPDMRAAMQIIRDEQGPDAVILGNRKVPGGIEIVSAIDYDAGKVDSATLFDDKPAPTPAAAPAHHAPSDEQLAPHDTATAGYQPPVSAYAAVEASLATEFPEQDPYTPPPTPPSRPSTKPSTRSAAPPADKDRWDAHNKDDLNDAERSVRRATELLKAARAAVKPDNEILTRAPARETPRPPRRAPRTSAVQNTPSKRKPMAPPIKPINRDAPAVADALGARSAAGASASNEHIRAMQQELQAMRELMSQQLDVMGWGNVTRQQPARVNLLTRLHRMGIGSELAMTLCDCVTSDTDPSKNWRDALAMLKTQIPESSDDMVEHGGIYALVGSTGVGKTTAIAKLAAQCAMRHGKENVALISADNMRVGAREQLRSFAAILDVPLVFSENAEQLERETQRMRDRKLVLVDTAGLSVNDSRIGECLALLRRVPTVRPILTLAANSEAGAIDQSCRVFGDCEPVGCVVTKVDEAHALGGVITALVEHKIPLTWFGNGQRVPEDLSRGSAASLLRMSLATEDLRQPGVLPVEELASRCGPSRQFAHD